MKYIIFIFVCIWVTLLMISYGQQAIMAIDEKEFETEINNLQQGKDIVMREKKEERSLNDQLVILLHGLRGSSKSMQYIEKALQGEGYSVINYDYPSTSEPIEKLTEDIFRVLRTRMEDARVVHFVTHSMGGIILRWYLQDHDIEKLGRVVMLVPPSKGSEIVDKLSGIFLFELITGPAGLQLGTKQGSIPVQLNDPNFELGIIAADKSINPFLSMFLPGKDDGRVSLDRVCPEVFTDYVCLPTSHLQVLSYPRAIVQMLHFIKEGRFLTEN